LKNGSGSNFKFAGFLPRNKLSTGCSDNGPGGGFGSRRIASSPMLPPARSVGYDPQAHDVPSTFWESDVDFDPVLGNLYGRHDARMPLCRRLRFHAAADVPTLAVERAALALGGVKSAVIAALAEYSEELDGLPISERVAILAELLSYPLDTIRSYTYRALAGRRAELAGGAQSGAGELDHPAVMPRSL
jgi:hypothetical protein